MDNGGNWSWGVGNDLSELLQFSDEETELHTENCPSCSRCPGHNPDYEILNPYLMRLQQLTVETFGRLHAPSKHEGYT